MACVSFNRTLLPSTTNDQLQGVCLSKDGSVSLRSLQRKSRNVKIVATATDRGKSVAKIAAGTMAGAALLYGVFQSHIMALGAAHAVFKAPRVNPSVNEEVYMSRKKDAIELYNQIQAHKKPYVDLCGRSRRGKTELLKEMSRVENGILYLRYSKDYWGFISGIYKSLGGYFKAYMNQSFVRDLTFFLNRDDMRDLKGDYKHVFGKNGLLMNASKDYLKRTGKRAIFIIDNVDDNPFANTLGTYYLLKEAAKELGDDSPMIIVFVRSFLPGKDRTYVLPYKEVSKEDLERHLVKTYKIKEEQAMKIATAKDGQIYLALNSAEAIAKRESGNLLCEIESL